MPSQETLTYINFIIQFFNLIVLIIYVIKTWEMANATRQSALAAEKSILEMKEMRDQESAPYVVAFFDLSSDRHVIDFVIKNIGKSIAEKIKISVNPELKTSLQVSGLSETSLIKNGISSLPPNYEIRAALDSVTGYFGNDLPLMYDIRISYYGGLQKTERIFEQTLDLSAQKGLLYFDKKDLGDLVKEVNSLRDEMKSSTQEMSKIANVLRNGVRTLNSGALFELLVPQSSYWKDSLIAKLQEIQLLWHVTYKNSRLERYETGGLQIDLGHKNDQLGILIANRPTETSPSIISELHAINMRLYDLSKMWFYIDGGNSDRNFNNQGDEIMRLIEELTKTLNTEI